MRERGTERRRQGDRKRGTQREGEKEGERGGVEEDGEKEEQGGPLFTREYGGGGAARASRTILDEERVSSHVEGNVILNEREVSGVHGDGTLVRVVDAVVLDVVRGHLSLHVKVRAVAGHQAHTRQQNGAYDSQNWPQITQKSLSSERHEKHTHDHASAARYSQHTSEQQV